MTHSLKKYQRLYAIRNGELVTYSFLHFIGFEFIQVEELSIGIGWTSPIGEVCFSQNDIGKNVFVTKLAAWEAEQLYVDQYLVNAQKQLAALMAGIQQASLNAGRIHQIIEHLPTEDVFVKAA